MSFRWEHYLDVAHALAPDAHPHRPQPVPPALQSLFPEARYRCAVSRAYYAAFATCREFVRVQAPSFPLPPDAREHSDVRRWFLASSASDEKKIGRHLNKLAEWRRQADYEAHVTGLDWKKTAGATLSLAEEICQRLQPD